jgi:ribulose-phosphate 3-epimerase
MQKSGIKVAPSLLSADFADLQAQIKLVEDAGAGLLHVDVMDGHFVPNITFGPMMVGVIKRLARSPLDVHLMISEPERYLERFIEAGSDYVTFHVEAVSEAGPLLEKARVLGAKPGIALNPATELAGLDHILGLSDLVVMMTVNPGFGGQGFLREVVPKIRALYELRARQGWDFEIEVDGGVNVKTASLAAWAGGDILVAGAAVFKSDDPAKAVREIHAAGLEGLLKREDSGAFPLAPPGRSC